MADKTTFSVDFSDVDDFEALPAGVYEVEVTKAEVKASQSSDFPYINWTLSVIQGDHRNRTLFHMTSFSPKALFKMKETLVAFGEDSEALSGKAEIDPESYIGSRAEASVIQESYQGKMQNRVESLSRLVGETNIGRSPDRQTVTAGGRRTLR